mmetsp:Transcript_121943/g.248963  ORF Transcript_121943/g.248963 Transcript_121943/m.248963 type:complete len:311 (+) Transcript_121943:60-992(+)
MPHLIFPPKVSLHAIATLGTAYSDFAAARKANMASRTPRSGTGGLRAPPRGSKGSGREPPALEPREPGWIGGSVTLPVVGATCTGDGATGGGGDGVNAALDFCCRTGARAAGSASPSTLVRLKVLELDRLPAGLPARLPGAAADPTSTKPSSVDTLRVWSFNSEDALMGKGIFRMKDCGSSVWTLNSRSIFARRSRKICSSSSSERSSLRMPSPTGGPVVATAGGAAVTKVVPPSSWSWPSTSLLEAPLRNATSNWFASSSRMPNWEMLLCREGGPTCCSECTLRNFLRFSFIRGCLLLSRFMKQPLPRR